MNDNPPGKIVILSSDTFSTKLTNHPWIGSRLIAAKNMAGFIDLFKSNFGCIGMLDLDPGANDFSNRIITSHNLLQNNHHATMFAAVHSPHPLSTIELTKAGFAAVFRSLSQKDWLVGSAKKHFKSVPIREAGIEQVVSNNLPWNP